MEITKILVEILRRTKVVSPVLEEAVHRSVKKLWPECQMSEGHGFQVVGLTRGVLHLVVESHALMSEAKAFKAERLRDLINIELEKKNKEELHDLAQGTLAKWKVTSSQMTTRFIANADCVDADYVTRIVFKVVGMQ